MFKTEPSSCHFILTSHYILSKTSNYVNKFQPSFDLYVYQILFFYGFWRWSSYASNSIEREYLFYIRHHLSRLLPQFCTLVLIVAVFRRGLLLQNINISHLYRLLYRFYETFATINYNFFLYCSVLNFNFNEICFNISAFRNNLFFIIDIHFLIIWILKIIWEGHCNAPIFNLYIISDELI